MTLQQLKYMIQVVQCGSISMAAQKLFITQPSLSKAIADLEQEMGITIFYRSRKGMTLSDDGIQFLSYARQVVEQADLLEQKYKRNKPVKRIFAVASQHYAFVVNAFVSLIQEYGKEEYEFSLRELRTYDIMEEVRTQRSEIGVLYLSDHNREVLLRILQNHELKFIPLFTAEPHIFVSRKSPLASKSEVTQKDLTSYPRLTYDQGINNSFYFSEELHSTDDAPKSIIVSDRATLFNLLIGLDGYTISSGILSSDLNGTEIVSIPLRSEQRMEIGYVHAEDRPLTKMAQQYLIHLKNIFQNIRM